MPAASRHADLYAHMVIVALMLHLPILCNPLFWTLELSLLPTKWAASLCSIHFNVSPEPPSSNLPQDNFLWYWRHRVSLDRFWRHAQLGVLHCHEYYIKQIMPSHIIRKCCIVLFVHIICMKQTWKNIVVRCCESAKISGRSYQKNMRR